MTATQVDRPAVNVFMGSDGTIYHSRCWQPLAYQTVRGGLALDFYCAGCVEHVTLPVHTLPAIPMRRRSREARRRTTVERAGLTAGVAARS